MDVIRRIFGRSLARARASNRAKDWPVPAQGFRFPGIARPRDAASPRGAEGESAGTALRNTTHPLRDLGWPVHAGEVPTRAAGVPGATVHRDPRTVRRVIFGRGRRVDAGPGSLRVPPLRRAP